MIALSRAAQCLWAKKANDGSMLWLPLWMHMSDSAAAARMLWSRWLPRGVKKAIAGSTMNEDLAERLFIFLAAAHDLGKATPVFQAKPAQPPCPELDCRIEEGLSMAGLPMKPYSAFTERKKTPHALATQVLLEEAGCNKNAAVILGAHHGKPPSNAMLASCGIDSFGFNYHLEQEGKEAWTTVQQELIAYAADLAGFTSLTQVPRPNLPGQVLLSGLLIMTDWIASNARFFPHIRLEDSPDPLQAKSRGTAAWEQFGLTPPWEADNTWMNADLYQRRFNFVAPNTVQAYVTETIRNILEPGIMVLEAPMGVGKTEAALVAAEAFANITQRSGVFFALPTQATSDAIFPRMLEWVKHLETDSEHTIMLAHGKAQFNKDFQGLKFLDGVASIGEDESDTVIVHHWFEGQKKSLLADFVVGTIDQLLLAALKQKHVMLRHLGLANKVVIIDECHAYDAYMGRYLDMALRWLGRYKVPVIVLSATLPAQKRRAIIDAYLNQDSAAQPFTDPLSKSVPAAVQKPDWADNRSYPLITYSDGDKVKQTAVPVDCEVSRTISILPLAEDQLTEKLDELLSDGGCAGVIANTVQRAQAIANNLRGHFGHSTVRLLHSRFLAPHRSEKEREILAELGKPGPDTRRPSKRILVGTQVLEQSLDIDFDVLVTDLCPMDLLLQRIGRLHRHARSRPDKLKHACCLVMGMEGDEFEPGAQHIYGAYLLMRTRALLPPRLTLPQDIPNLVQNVYDDSFPLPSEPPGYREAKKDWDKLLHDKEYRAGAFRICPPWPDPIYNIAGWLDKDVSDHHGDAAVRDADESIEVLLLQEINGYLHMLDEPDGFPLVEHSAPDPEVAQTIARQRIRLPNALCAHWIIDQTIAELERITGERLQAWQKSPWLRGELFLILDENSTASLCGYKLTYDKDNGLTFEKEVETDG
ncbi:MAG TPA: CRISPR-associated helicase Cas3' [Bacillota bacterium]|nr:CRISPR-associated helicase Cas3' [Bacillota bacterium]